METLRLILDGCCAITLFTALVYSWSDCSKKAVECLITAALIAAAALIVVDGAL